MKASDSRYNKCIYFSSNALARKIERLAMDCWKKVGLAPSHAYLLMMVLEEPGMQPGLAAEELQLSPSTVTRLIEKLEEKKLVVRTTEGKLTNIYPTPKAKELFPLMKTCTQEFQDQYNSLLGKEESSKLVGAINRINDKLP
ncbi:MarR family winged helix-turn-helix transcriptional regulator [Flavihumibacter sp. UBA7668]|uniref:MarR family winged helix-turn-helix transcriptional regulator n=1 Tax=Flavihumibacter sp. UBA7668 TaxID=1946542 RepID=UPI0025C010C1|nr:MarR family winged helix-turn-helix transcriptional regulator [Flavihumibacter sp. UBA7668]